MDAFASDPQICRQCRGLCCQGHPGVWADPVRFADLFLGGRRLSPELLGTELSSLGLTVKDMRGVPVPSPPAGEEGCTFLGAKGCRLPEEKRPCQCLALAPSIDTLIEGEIRCRLPGEFSYGVVRERWQAYWRDFRPRH